MADDQDVTVETVTRDAEAPPVAHAPLPPTWASAAPPPPAPPWAGPPATPPPAPPLLPQVHRPEPVLAAPAPLAPVPAAAPSAPAVQAPVPTPRLAQADVPPPPARVVPPPPPPSRPTAAPIQSQYPDGYTPPAPDALRVQRPSKARRLIVTGLKTTLVGLLVIPAAGFVAHEFLTASDPSPASALFAEPTASAADGSFSTVERDGLQFDVPTGTKATPLDIQGWGSGKSWTYTSGRTTVRIQAVEISAPMSGGAAKKFFAKMSAASVDSTGGRLVATGRVSGPAANTFQDEVAVPSRGHVFTTFMTSGTWMVSVVATDGTHELPRAMTKTLETFRFD